MTNLTTQDIKFLINLFSFYEEAHDKSLSSPLTILSLNDLAVGSMKVTDGHSIDRKYVRSPSRQLPQKVLQPDMHLREDDWPTDEREIMTVYKKHKQLISAERLATELISSLKVLDSRAGSRLVWSFVDNPANYVMFLGRPFDFACDIVWSSLDNIGADREMFGLGNVALPPLVKATVEAHAGWEFAASNDVPMSGPEYAISRIGADPIKFSSLVNPFSVLTSLWKTECFIFRLPDEHDSAIRLYTRYYDIQCAFPVL